MTDRISRLLDDIDELVDASLARGDRSQSFHGEQMPRCRWCREPWHGLPITKKMVEMRNNPYAHDEFGQVILDPNYKYSEDKSDWVCPGSDFHGPETPGKSWRSVRPRPQFEPGRYYPPLVWQEGRAPASLQVWRFKPPYENWQVNLNAHFTRQPDGTYNHSYQATFRALGPPASWQARDLTQYNMQLRRWEEPIKFDYTDMRMSPVLDDRGNPEWVDFMTDFPLQHTYYDWCRENWEVRALTIAEIDAGGQFVETEHYEGGIEP